MAKRNDAKLRYDAYISLKVERHKRDQLDEIRKQRGIDRATLMRIILNEFLEKNGDKS